MMSQQPNLLQGPEPVDTADLHFKQYCKLKLFETQSKYDDGHCNLVAVSQHYGLIFARNSTGFSVLKTKSISPTTNLDSFPRKDIVLSLKPTHLSVDFSQKILAVVCTSKPGATLLLYNIALFSTKDVMPMKITAVSNLIQNLAAEVTEIQWQPNADSGLTMCLSDGSIVALSQPMTDAGVFTLPSTTQATCLCWSPKGKQIVIGCANGTLSQYKPNLKMVKTLPPPPLFNGSVMVISVLWISSYQFAVAYNDRNSPETFPVITIVNATKNEPVNVINYDDITYSNTLFRNHQIYMSHQSAWNLIFVSSANSIEVAVLHSRDGTAWEQWLLGDASRAELPLNPDRQETFPLGWAFDFTSQETIPWGEGTLPPMPRLLLLSDEGLLCIYNIVNAAENAPQLCGPPKETLDDSFFVPPKTVAVVVCQSPAVSQTSLSFTGQTSSAFGNLKPTYTFGSAPTFGMSAAQPQSTAPNVTISIPGGPVLGNVKDASLIIQQQQQQQQQPVQQFQQQQQPIQQPQQFQKQEQSVNLAAQPAATTTNFKFSATPQFGTPAAPTFAFGASSASSLFAAKAAAAASAASGNVATAKFGSPQVSLFGAKPTPPPEGNIFAGKTLLQSTPIKQPEPAAEKAASKPPATPKQADEVPEPVGKAEDVPAKGKTPVGSPEPGTPELPAVDDSVYWNALQEEIDHFNSELQQLCSRVGTLDIQVGTEEDKKKMRESIDVLYDFWRELKETTESQKSEIHSVLMDLMESFAWLEDAKSRNLQRKNPSYIELKKSEELDPLSARHMSDISHYKYYIENQLKQLTSYLEKEWMDHQESCRREFKNRMTVPPLEEVYKTMHFQLKILNKQRALVEELKENIALKKRKNKCQVSLVANSSPVAPSPNDARVSELSKLAENLLQLKIDREEKSVKSEKWTVIQSQLRAISERSKKLTKEKQVALRDVLGERDMVKIRPVKTTFESSSFLRSTALEKVASKQRSEGKPQPKEKQAFSQLTPPQNPVAPSPSVGSLPTKPPAEKVEAPEKTPKSIFVFGVPPAEKPVIPLTVQSLPSKPEEKSPLASLSGIVSSIGKEPEPKPKPSLSTFVFGTTTFQKPEPAKDAPAFGSAKTEQKPEEAKAPQTFSFGMFKPSETLFNKNEPLKFGSKFTFGVTTSTPSPPSATTKAEAPKMTTTAPPNVSISPVATTAAATAAATTTAPSFTFSFAPSSTPTSTALPKMNLSFSGKERSSASGTPPATASFLGSSSAPPESSSVSIFGSSAPIFGNAGSKPVTTTFLDTFTPSLFGPPKTSADVSAQTTAFVFSQPADNKTKSVPENVVVISSKSETETEEVDVVTVEETVKKPEAGQETKAKDSPKATVTPSIFGGTPEPPKSTPQVTTSVSVAPPNVQVPSTPQTSTPATTTTTNVFAKAVTATTADTPTTSASVATTTTTASFFSFATTSPLVFGQTAQTPTTAATTATVTTTAAAAAVTTATGIFGKTSSVFGQVSSTTPTSSIFGGSSPTTPTTNIFGDSTPTSTPAFAQGLTASGSVFGATTPTTNTFGQPSSPSSPSSFGQNPDPVGQTANIFGQLLSESSPSGSVFGATSGAQTTAHNIFSTPKNIFAKASTATTPVFGGTTSPSAFPQTTTVFGQPTTSASVFKQSQTSTSSSYFGQNICSPFGGGTSVTSNQSSFESGGFNSKPIFGQSPFGQNTSNTSIFGDAPSSSIFGGGSASGTNVFQTPTTSTTFGSTSPGPFSSSQGSVAETGFGAAATFQKPLGGFGSPPVFGGGPSAPAFGGSPTFGGSASFGSLPTFGSRPFETSPGSVQGTFGQSSGHSTTFENLANQNTVGFGNLAQQSQSQGFGGAARFGSSFENKPPDFARNSFSSWRS